MSLTRRAVGNSRPYGNEGHGLGVRATGRQSNEMLCLGSALGPGRALGCRDFGRALGPQADKALRCCTSVGR